MYKIDIPWLETWRRHTTRRADVTCHNLATPQSLRPSHDQTGDTHVARARNLGNTHTHIHTLCKTGSETGCAVFSALTNRQKPSGRTAWNTRHAVRGSNYFAPPLGAKGCWPLLRLWCMRRSQRLQHCPKIAQRWRCKASKRSKVEVPKIAAETRAGLMNT